MTTPTPEIPPVDPQWCLPDKPDATGTMTGPTFARLLAAGRAGGWPAIYRTWAKGETTVEINQNGKPHERPARRRVLDRFLARREDLRQLLAEACEEKRDRLLNELENEIEAIAMGPGDTATDFDKNGNVTRVRTDKRNKLYAILQLLKANDRERYGDQRSVKVDGNIDHRHAHAHLGVNPGGYVVNFEAMQAALTEDEARLLMGFLERVEAERMNQQRQRIADDNRRRATLPAGQPQHGDQP